jgi:hypothetical protein
MAKEKEKKAVEKAAERETETETPAPKASRETVYVAKTNVDHGRPDGTLLRFKTGDVVEGLTKSEIKSFLENGLIELQA